MTKTQIRWMSPRDLPLIMAIERRCFEFPWSEDEFTRTLQRRNFVAMVAECGEQVVGFMIYELHKSRFHVHSLAVVPGARRRGVGRALLARLQDKLSLERRTHIMTEVRGGNLGAHLFFKRIGFRAKAVLHNFYDECDEDAYLFVYRPHITAQEIADPRNRILRFTHPQESE